MTNEQLFDAVENAANLALLLYNDAKNKFINLTEAQDDYLKRMCSQHVSQLHPDTIDQLLKLRKTN